MSAHDSSPRRILIILGAGFLTAGDVRAAVTQIVSRVVAGAAPAPIIVCSFSGIPKSGSH